MGNYSVRNFDDALKIMKDAGVEELDSPRANHPELARELARELIAKMTLKEKSHMLSGHWNTLPGMLHGRVYNYDPIAGGGCKRLGIPPLLFTDGPRGVVMKNATCFPTSNTRAAASHWRRKWVKPLQRNPSRSVQTISQASASICCAIHPGEERRKPMERTSSSPQSMALR